MAPLESSGPRQPPNLSPAPIPNLTDKIVRPDDWQYCAAGAFGDVFRSRYTSDDGVKEVAVKAFRFAFFVDDLEHKRDGGKAARMIRRELGIWSRLSHRNIVPFLGITYGFGRQGNASLVSMWMPHGTLHTFLETHGDRLAVAHRLQLLLDIANGLHYLHSFPMVHGDLSSNNVLVDHNYNACLTDFGCASLIGDLPEGFTYLKGSTVRPGTLRWTAPEHFSSNEEGTKHTIKSDIYSFGNMALLVLSGKYPWSEVQTDGVVVLNLFQGVKPARPLARPIDNQHWALIERCWSSIPERPLAEDVVSSLQQFLGACTPPPPLHDLLNIPTPSPSIPNRPGNDDLDDSAASTRIESQQSSTLSMPPPLERPPMAPPPMGPFTPAESADYFTDRPTSLSGTPWTTPQLIPPPNTMSPPLWSGQYLATYNAFNQPLSPMWAQMVPPPMGPFAPAPAAWPMHPGMSSHPAYAPYTPWKHPTQQPPPMEIPGKPGDTAQAVFRWTNNADRMDPFAEGPHYGPVLEPFLATIVGAVIRLNPLLAPPLDTQDDYIRWNMLFHTSDSYRTTESQRPWVKGRNAPATHPRVTHIRIVSRAFPWMIRARAQNPELGVTCGEVLDAISMCMDVDVAKKEYDNLPSEMIRQVMENYRFNRSTDSSAPEERLGESLKWLDWLGSTSRFGGLVANKTFVKEHCGDVLPCTFELKCLPSYPLTAEEVREQQRRLENPPHQLEPARQQPPALPAIVRAASNDNDD